MSRNVVHRLSAANDSSQFSPSNRTISGADAELPSYVDSYLGSLPAHLRRQVRAMLMLFEQATFFFPAPGPNGRRRFSGLSPEQRMAVLAGWSESRLFLRRIAFIALRAVLTMGYLAHPNAMRAVNLAPFDVDSPVCEADLLYPRIGAHPDEIALTAADSDIHTTAPLPAASPEAFTTIGAPRSRT